MCSGLIGVGNTTITPGHPKAHASCQTLRADGFDVRAPSEAVRCTAIWAGPSRSPLTGHCVRRDQPARYDALLHSLVQCTA